MKILIIVCRIILGLILILSSTVKGVDPMGTALKLDEWFKALNLGFLGFTSNPLALVLIVSEYVTGCAILLGVKMKFFSRFALYLMGFFTLVTIYAYIFNPVSDCGCFGNAIPMSNIQSLIKNIILLVCSFQIFLFYRYAKSNTYRNLNVRWQKIRALGGRRTELSIVILFSCAILAVSLWSFVSIPVVEWGPYKVGTDLVFANTPEDEQESELVEDAGATGDVMYLYSKDGETKAFSLDNIPDSTWTFLDIVPERQGSFLDSFLESILKIETKPAPLLPMRNQGGFYVSSAILSSVTDIVFISIPKIDDISDSEADRLVELANGIYDRTPYTCFILCAASSEQIREKFKNRLFGRILVSDYKTLLSLNRNNAGVSLVHSGLIIAKLPSVLKAAPAGLSMSRLMRILSYDPDDVEIRSLSRASAFVQIFFVGTLIVIYLLRIFLRRKKIMIAQETEITEKQA